MLIYVTTYGRANRQTTFMGLPPSLQAQTKLVVQQREAWKYSDRDNVIALPDSVRDLSATRQWVVDNHDIEQHGPNLVMLDDDLKFATRRKDDPTKFLKSTREDIEQLFREIEASLVEYVHVGVHFRQAANRVTVPFKENARLICVLAYHVPTLRKHNIRFDRLILKSDFDATLQLIRLGYKNKILCDWVQDHRTSNDKGGCSAYRTVELMEECAKKLAELHHPFVKVVSRTVKGDTFGGGTRLDNLVQWKKAYESSQ